jgi:hypothetical protein
MDDPLVFEQGAKVLQPDPLGIADDAPIVEADVKGVEDEGELDQDKSKQEGR